MALPLGSEQAPRAGWSTEQGWGVEEQESLPPGQFGSPSPTCPEGRGQGGGPGAGGQWTGTQAHGCQAVEMSEARPRAPEVPPHPPLPRLPPAMIHPCVSVFVHVCVSLWVYVSLPPALFSLASPLSAPSYTSRGGQPLWWSQAPRMDDGFVQGGPWLKPVVST